MLAPESSGAYHQLAEGAVSVSPADIEGTMEAMYQAINMTPAERKQRAAILVDSVWREDITHWIYRQLEDIGKLL